MADQANNEYTLGDALDCYRYLHALKAWNAAHTDPVRLREAAHAAIAKRMGIDLPFDPIFVSERPSPPHLDPTTFAALPELLWMRADSAKRELPMGEAYLNDLASRFVDQACCSVSEAWAMSLSAVVGVIKSSMEELRETGMINFADEPRRKPGKPRTPKTHISRMKDLHKSDPDKWTYAKIAERVNGEFETDYTAEAVRDHLKLRAEKRG